MSEDDWWNYFTENKDGLMLDMFCPRFRAIQVLSQEKIPSGEVRPRTFHILCNSAQAWKYNFKVCQRHCKEEKHVSRHYNKCLDKEETS